MLGHLDSFVYTTEDLKLPHRASIKQTKTKPLTIHGKKENQWGQMRTVLLKLR